MAPASKLARDSAGPVVNRTVEVKTCPAVGSVCVASEPTPGTVISTRAKTGLEMVALNNTRGDYSQPGPGASVGERDACTLTTLQG